MEVIIKPKKSKNVIATIAIGEVYYNEWSKNILPNWKKYCQNNNLGLIVFKNHLISENDPKWKKPHWQKMLVGREIKKNNLNINSVCWLDTDTLVNPYAPNIFDYYDEKTIGLVSLRKNLPFNYNLAIKKLAFLRNKFYDSDYPLDSALFMTCKQLYEYHNLPEQSDEACGGTIVFNLKNHSHLFEKWFYKYDKNIKGLTPGEQTHLNYEIQNYGKITWLNYKFQSIWTFEMAMYYPFLYNFGRNDNVLIRECIEACLKNNFFLHFAGSWHESTMWKIGKFFDSEKKMIYLKDFEKYLKLKVYGSPRGMIKPK